MVGVLICSGLLGSGCLKGDEWFLNISVFAPFIFNDNGCINEILGGMM